MPAPPVSLTPWQRLPADLSTALRPRLADTVRAVVKAITEATPAFAGLEGSKLERDVHTAVQVALKRFLDLIGTDEPALPSHVREVFVSLGAAEAREDRGPEALLAALRIASRLMLRMCCAGIAAIRPVGTEELIDLSDAVSAYVDELATATTDGFTLQLREQAGEGDRRRRQLAEMLLRGGAPESVVRSAAAGIGWPEVGDMVPVVLPLEHARDARFRYGADGIVIERERDAVLLLRAVPRATRPRLAEALAGRCAVVGPTVSWAQVSEGVRLAELAAELVRPNPGRHHPERPGPERPGSGLVFADDHLAALALRGEPGALVVLSTRRLTPLRVLRPVQRERLLSTLHSWLRHWGSRAEVSAELFVHPQTVSYRLKLLRELLGDDLDDPVARFELLLVLAFRATDPTASGCGNTAG